jgi:hypothetical protein
VLDRNWKVTPDATSEFVIYAHPGREHVNEGQAQGGDATHITLNVLASPQNDTYIRQLISLKSGTGEDQVRLCIAYNGTTKVATVDVAWDIIPDATTGYVVLPTQIYTTAELEALVLAQSGAALTAYPAATETKQDTAALINTEARLAELDAANMPADLDAVKAKTDNLPEGPQKNQPYGFQFEMVLAVDGETPAPGLVVTATVQKDTGSYAPAAGVVTEIGTGTYYFAATAADMNGDSMMFKFSAPTARDTPVSVDTTT